MATDLIISPHEALIIEVCFKYPLLSPDMLSEHRWFFLQIGHIIVDDEIRMLSMEESELWMLRDIISPNIRVGNITGLDLLKKIYVALFTLHNPDPIELPEPLKKEVMQVSLEKEKKDDNEDRTESSPENT